jgi:hypothetical protein
MREIPYVIGRNFHARERVLGPMRRGQFVAEQQSMRQTFTTGSRVAVLAVPVVAGGTLADLWRTFINELFDPYRPGCTTCGGPARNGARGMEWLSPAEGIGPSKGHSCRAYFPVPPSK